MAERIEELHREVHDRLEKAFKSYKETKDKSRREAKFEKGNLVMIHLRKNRSPTRTYNLGSTNTRYLTRHGL